MIDKCHYFKIKYTITNMTLNNNNTDIYGVKVLFMANEIERVSVVPREGYGWIL